MKTSQLRLLSSFLVCATAPAFAQTTPPPASARTPAPAAAPAPAPAYAGLTNEKLRAANAGLGGWDIGVNIRVRADDKEEAGATDAGSNWDFSKRPQDDNQNQYSLLRVMPRVGYTRPWFSFLAEARSSYSFGDERYNPAAPGKGLSDSDGPLDLHQAYVQLGNLKEFPLTFRLGRQELAFGDQRLVGASRWGNNPRSFDALKVRWQNASVGVDLFTGSVVYVDDNAFNRSNPQDLLSGVYLNFPTISRKDLVEGYLFARNVERGIVTDDWAGIAAPARFPAPQDLYTAGVRFKSKPKAYGSWDYTAEAMYQFGSRTAVAPGATVAAALAAKRLDQSAYAFIAQGGYTWSSSKSAPRLALIYSFASGDKDAADSDSQTFQNLLPSNHGLYGAMDLTGLQNLHDLRLQYTFKPVRALTLTVEGHVQYLARTTDYWYNAAGVPRNFAGAPVGSGAGYRINPAYDKQLGQELDVLAAWAVTRYALVEAGAAHYFRGDYIKESLRNSGSHDASYAYLQVTLNL